MSEAVVWGAGRLGLGLAVALPTAGVSVLGAWSHSAAGAREAADLSGLPTWSGPAAALPEAGRAALAQAELIFLTVRDDAIAPTCQALCEAGLLRPGQALVHASGASDLGPLAPATALGLRVGSLHPLQAFSDRASAHTRFAGALAVVDAPSPLGEELEAIARALEMRPTRLASTPAARALYHAAAVNAAGNLVATLSLSLELAAAAGLSPEEALSGLLTLARGSLENLERLGDPGAALTGPVPRGDQAVIERHLGAMAAALPGPSESLYRALSRRAIALCAEAGRLSPAAAQALRASTAPDEASRT